MPSVLGGLTILMATVAGALGGMLVGSPWGAGTAGRAAEPATPLAARVTSLEERLVRIAGVTSSSSLSTEPGSWAWIARIRVVTGLGPPEGGWAQGWRMPG